MHNNEFHCDIVLSTYTLFVSYIRSYKLPSLATLLLLWIHFLFTDNSFLYPCSFIPLGDPVNFLGLFIGA